MSEQQNEGFFERALNNLSTAWREVAAGAARSVGLSLAADPARDARSFRRLMSECLEARGGEVSARLRAAELGRTYLDLDADGKRTFLEVLARDFDIDHEAVSTAIDAYGRADAETGRLKAAETLRLALAPPRVRLLTQFNVLPEGVKFLADLRHDLLSLTERDAQLRGLERDLRVLLESWFDVGFLDLRRITWDSPASLLEKLIAYEAVHEIRSWHDLRNRLDSDRRLYALFHPRMADEPLAFIEVALGRGIAGNIQSLLDEQAPQSDPGQADTAVFYSISNTQPGLSGIAFGDYLIKRVVERISGEFPQLKTFVTLSPVPGFRAWLRKVEPGVIAACLDLDVLRQLPGGSEAADARVLLDGILERLDWHRDPKLVSLLADPLLCLAARYLVARRGDGRPQDPVARFHLRNGARLERINWLADTSARGLKQSAGIMVNYRYLLGDIEKNHESYLRDKRVIMSAEVRALVRQSGYRPARGRRDAAE